MEKFCQSCSILLELHGQDVRGEVKRWESITDLLLYCYVNGAFVEPDITFEQMVNRGKQQLPTGKVMPLLNSL